MVKKKSSFSEKKRSFSEKKRSFLKNDRKVGIFTKKVPVFYICHQCLQGQLHLNRLDHLLLGHILGTSLLKLLGRYIATSTCSACSLLDDELLERQLSVADASERARLLARCVYLRGAPRPAYRKFRVVD